MESCPGRYCMKAVFSWEVKQCLYDCYYEVQVCIFTLYHKLCMSFLCLQSRSIDRTNKKKVSEANMYYAIESGKI